MIKIVIYEDNPQLREGLFMLIDGSEGFKVLATFKNANDAPEEVMAWKPDVVLMDIDMPGTSGIEALKKIREVNDQVKIVMLTVFDDNKNVFEAIRSGANGYILKKTPPARLLEYLEEAYAGGAPMTASIATQVLKMFSEIHNPKSEDYHLSEREKQVLQLLVNGYSYKMIAAEMYIAIDTVRSHIKKVYEKLHVNSKSEAVAKAFKSKIVYYSGEGSKFNNIGPVHSKVCDTYSLLFNKTARYYTLICDCSSCDTQLFLRKLIKANVMPVYCLNCGDKIQHGKNYCPSCGQKTHIERITLKVLVDELIHFFTHFEHTFIHTSKRMIVNPGRVMSQYLQGKRKLYDKPVHFYLLWITIEMLLMRVIVHTCEYEPVPMPGINGDTPEQVLALMKYAHLSFLFCLPVTAALNYFIMGRPRLLFFETFALCLYIYGDIFMGITFINVLGGYVFHINIISWQFFIFQASFGTLINAWGTYDFYKKMNLFRFIPRLIIFTIINVLLVVKCFVLLNALWLELGI